MNFLISFGGEFHSFGEVWLSLLFTTLIKSAYRKTDFIISQP